MDMKKALQNHQKTGTAPFVVYISHVEYRVVYQVIDLGDAAATLSTSYPIDRDTADAVLKGQTDPDWIDRGTGKPERLTQVIRYDDIAYADFGG